MTVPQGLTKNETLDYLKSMKGIDIKSVRALISSMKMSAKMDCPDCIKVGDVFYHKGLLHYAVVISRKKDVVLSILVTSNGSDTSVIDEVKTRFGLKGYFTYTMISSTTQQVSDNFVGVYDNVTHLRKVKKKLKQFFKKCSWAL